MAIKTLWLPCMGMPLLKGTYCWTQNTCLTRTVCYFKWTRYCVWMNKKEAKIIYYIKKKAAATGAAGRTERKVGGRLLEIWIELLTVVVAYICAEQCFLVSYYKVLVIMTKFLRNEKRYWTGANFGDWPEEIISLDSDSGQNDCYCRLWQ